MIDQSGVEFAFKYHYLVNCDDLFGPLLTEPLTYCYFSCLYPVSTSFTSFTPLFFLINFFHYFFADCLDMLCKLFLCTLDRRTLERDKVVHINLLNHAVIFVLTSTAEVNLLVAVL